VQGAVCGSVAGVLSVEGSLWFFCWWGVSATSEHALLATANRSKHVCVVGFIDPCGMKYDDSADLYMRLFSTSLIVLSSLISCAL
jgi:hypothetical protein